VFRMLTSQFITGCVLLGLWGVPVPALADSYTWTNQNGVTRMSNIETLFPEQKKIQVDPALPPPAPTSRVRAFTEGDSRPPKTDRELERAMAFVENLADRNQKVLELKEWFVRIMNNPKLFYDPAFVEWMKSIKGRELPATFRQKQP